MTLNAIRPWLARKWSAVGQIRKIDSDPRQIASGYSLGIFIGLMPLVGVKAFIAMGIASVLKWNKLAASIGVFNINPLTAPFFFGLNFVVGKQITGCSLSLDIPAGFSPGFWGELFQNGSELLVTLAIGGVLLGIPFAFIAYHASYYIVTKYRKQ